MPESGSIAGASAAQRARRLAGALAEAGVSELRLERPRLPAMLLRAREVDLPSLVVAAGADAVLSAPDGSIRVTLGPDELRWHCADSARAGPLRAATDVS